MVNKITSINAFQLYSQPPDLVPLVRVDGRPHLEGARTLKIEIIQNVLQVIGLDSLPWMRWCCLCFETTILDLVQLVPSALQVEVLVLLYDLFEERADQARIILVDTSSGHVCIQKLYLIHALERFEYQVDLGLLPFKRC